MTNKHLIAIGNVRINPKLLDEVIKDTPACSGNSDYLKCLYSGFECKGRCYASESISCSNYHLLNKYQRR